ncbi:hypothetical protein VFPBJ_00084 [Purpureocillium lilacinum]|uniref:Uncharacterized protein n=1 Tax=Purpureocillium lilacinum TaxID=33203 RepID=A0A179H7A7_PURLI|nr:hypothetical protein VFPBJ_00084 [Purpureocillium lilacinum]
MAEASSTLVACKLADPVNVKTRRPPRVPRLHKGDRRSVGTAWACTHVTSCCCRPPPSRADEEHHHLTIAQRLGGSTCGGSRGQPHQAAGDGPLPSGFGIFKRQEMRKAGGAPATRGTTWRGRHASSACRKTDSGGGARQDPGIQAAE